MRLKAPPVIALTLFALLSATGPAARAGTVTFAEAQRYESAGRQFRPASEVRLRVAPQSGGVSVAQGTRVPGPQIGSVASVGPRPSDGPGGAAGGSPDAALSAGGGSQIDTVNFGDVTGTVCDCGEIPIAALPKVVGGFPWWVVAGVPLVCVSGVCFETGDEDTPAEDTPNLTPTPPTVPPPPPPDPVPEPATLLLFGTGLLAAGAGARRRRQVRQQLAAADAEREV